MTDKSDFKIGSVHLLLMTTLGLPWWPSVAKIGHQKNLLLSFHQFNLLLSFHQCKDKLVFMKVESRKLKIKTRQKRGRHFWPTLLEFLQPND